MTEPVRSSRDREIIDAIKALASYIASGGDPVDMLTELTGDCASLLNGSSAGLLLADSAQVLHVMAASSEAARVLEVFEVQRHEGPCLDCYGSRERVSVPDLASEAERWPAFCGVAAGVGCKSVHAFPLLFGDRIVGALGIFSEYVGDLSEDDVNLIEALAHVATVALVAQRIAQDHEAVNLQLTLALQSRIVIEQAKGQLANAGGISMDEAFQSLRQYARDHQLGLTLVAIGVTAGEPSARDLLAYVRARRKR